MSPGVPRARVERWLALGLGLLVLGVHLASFDLARLPIVSDVRFYLYFAWRVSQGAVPHVDYFDHKTRLATFLGAGFHRLAGLLGADPLLVMRAGYLLLAGLGGALAFALHRRLAGERGLAGVLGVLAYCSFGLLGLLPATGCVPKLVVALCASAAALLTHRGRWLAAGALGSLAALDWQIGALVWLAVLATALLCAQARLRAALRVALGGALGLLPFCVYFGLQGALGTALAQVIGGSLDRSAGTQSRDSLGARLERIQQLIASDCPAQAWLVYLSLAGVLVALWLLVRRRELRSLLVPLCLFHAGIAAFSLLDLQWHADLFMLLHGVVFWQALLWGALWRVLVQRCAARARLGAAAGLVLGALLVTRPGPLRPALALETPQVSPRASLADQREVAAQVAQRFADRPIAFLESSELLFLLGRVNPLATVFWNDASWRHFRRDEESKDETLARLLRSAGVAAWVTARPFELHGHAPTIERIASRNGQYFVMLQTR